MSNDISDFITQQQLDQLARKPGDKRAMEKLAAENKRRLAFKRFDYGKGVQIGPDGVMAKPDDEDTVRYADAAHKGPGPGGGQFTGTGGGATPSSEDVKTRAADRAQKWHDNSKKLAEHHRQQKEASTDIVQRRHHQEEADKHERTAKEHAETLARIRPAQPATKPAPLPVAKPAPALPVAKIAPPKPAPAIPVAKIAPPLPTKPKPLPVARHAPKLKTDYPIGRPAPLKYAVRIGPDGVLADDEDDTVKYATTDSRRAIDLAAQGVHPEPTEGQRAAGNHRMAHVQIHNLDITIECAKGMRRRPEWEPLQNHYGYLKGTQGRDGEHIDCFIGPHPQSEVVFVIDQVSKGGIFQEHKVMIGFMNAESAKRAYLSNYPPGFTGFGGMKAMTVEAFKVWLRKGDTGKRVEPQRVTYADHDEKKHPRGEHGRWVSALGGIGHGELKHVGQFVEIASDGTMPKPAKKLTPGQAAHQQNQQAQKGKHPKETPAAHDPHDEFVSPTEEAAHIAHVLHAKAEAGFHKLPEPVQDAVRSVMAIAFVGWTASQKLAKMVAEEKGATPEEAAKIESTLATADIALFKPLAMSLTGAGALANAATWIIPPATGAYLLTSLVKNPLATLWAATTAIGALSMAVTSRLREKAGLSPKQYASEEYRVDYGWVTLENDQHVWIDENGTLKPSGPGTKGVEHPNHKEPIKPQAEPTHKPHFMKGLTAPEAPKKPSTPVDKSTDEQIPDGMMMDMKDWEGGKYAKLAYTREECLRIAELLKGAGATGIEVEMSGSSDYGPRGYQVWIRQTNPRSGNRNTFLVPLEAGIDKKRAKAIWKAAKDEASGRDKGAFGRMAAERELNRE